MRPDLDHWLAHPTIRVPHRRTASVGEAELWDAARTVRVADTRVLGRLVRWRIPGVPKSIAYDELFRAPPFMVLHEDDRVLVSGLVGRIWTLRRDYPALSGPDEFRSWSEPGTARVVFANWVEPAGPRHRPGGTRGAGRRAPADRGRPRAHRTRGDDGRGAQGRGNRRATTMKPLTSAA